MKALGSVLGHTPTEVALEAAIFEACGGGGGGKGWKDAYKTRLTKVFKWLKDADRGSVRCRQLTDGQIRPEEVLEHNK